MWGGLFSLSIEQNISEEGAMNCPNSHGSVGNFKKRVSNQKVMINLMQRAQLSISAELSLYLLTILKYRTAPS